MELGSRGWMDCLAAELFLNSCFSDTVFVTLLSTAVETAISDVHKWLRTGGVPTSLTLLFWWWLTTFFSVFTGQSARTSYSSRPLPSPPPFSPSLISRMVFVDVKHPLYLLCWFCPKSTSLSLCRYASACEVDAAAALRAFCAAYYLCRFDWLKLLG